MPWLLSHQAYIRCYCGDYDRYGTVMDLVQDEADKTSEEFKRTKAESKEFLRLQIGANLNAQGVKVTAIQGER